MTSVWYLGASSSRSISAAQWASAGVAGTSDSVWNANNGWSIPVNLFNSSQLTILGSDGEFNINAPDTARPMPPNPAPGSMYVTPEQLQAVLQQATSAGLDFRQLPLKDFHPSRDLAPWSPFGWYDASKLTGPDGSAVTRMPDRSGQSNDVWQKTPVNQFSLKANGLNGKNTIYSSTAAKMLSGSPDVFKASPRVQPFTYIALAKCPAATVNAQDVCGTAGAGAFGTHLGYLNAAYEGSPYLFAGGSTGASGSKNICDGQFHVIIGVYGTASSSAFVDGVLVGAAANQGHGADAATGAVQLGHSTYGVPGGEIAEVIMLDGDLPYAMVTAVTNYLFDKWGLNGANYPRRTLDGVEYNDLTDSGGQAVRMYKPRTWNGVWFDYGHHYGGATTLGDANFPSWPMIRTLVSNGYLVTISNNHGSYWGSDTAAADATNTLALVETTMGRTVDKIVAFGCSMGGLLAATRAKESRYGARLRAVILADAPLDLHWSYATIGGYGPTMDVPYGITAGTLSAATTAGATSVPTTAAYPTVGSKLIVGVGTANEEVVTTTAASAGGAVATTALTKTHASADKVSNYPDKTIGKDPVLWDNSTMPKGLRWRLYASPQDGTVTKSINADVMYVNINLYGAPIENTLISHTYGHLSNSAFQADDVINLCDRVLAAA